MTQHQSDLPWKLCQDYITQNNLVIFIVDMEISRLLKQRVGSIITASSDYEIQAY